MLAVRGRRSRDVAGERRAGLGDTGLDDVSRQRNPTLCWFSPLAAAAMPAPAVAAQSHSIWSSLPDHRPPTLMVRPAVALSWNAGARARDAQQTRLTAAGKERQWTHASWARPTSRSRRSV